MTNPAGRCECYTDWQIGETGGTIIYCPLHASAPEWKECATKLLEALVSYKRYIPFPYKQNPVYIMGANEAEEMFKRLSQKAEADR